MRLPLAWPCCWGCGDRNPSASKPPKPSAPSFSGTYRFDFDGNQQLAGGEPKPTKSRTHLYALRSECTDAGCFATATQLADDNPKRKSDPAVDLVLDYVDGHWQTALRRDDACTDSDIKGPSITAWILVPQPDGTLTGTSYVAMNPSPDCAVATSTPVTVPARATSTPLFPSRIRANRPPAHRRGPRAWWGITPRQAFCRATRDRAGRDRGALTCRACACAIPTSA